MKCLSPKHSLVVSSECGELTVGFLEPGQVSIHAIFARHFRALWEVVDLLVPTKGLVDHTLDVGTGPLDRPLLVSVRHLSEAIVFKREPHQWHVEVVVELEIVAFVCGFVWTHRNRIDVGSEDHVLFRDNVVNGFVLLYSLLECQVKLPWFVFDFHLVDLIPDFINLH